ncbi:MULTISPECIES: integrase arm-type DNA-binding domain-containing protein [unclassified Ruegeria]|uniref:tyrosine-type recombinase/integrase n=1 Tax=unclassified Ruegeria TaxID=2625375 RepID=UPI0014895289|nr:MULTISPECIES: integrase arm-type DNA-binding domain-containing protein [unclassified Ruegeria]
MARGMHRLTVKQVENAAPGTALNDGGGLSLRCTANGTKRWVFRFTLKGQKQREMGLGGFPGTTLAQARQKATAARDLLASGIDPIAEAEREAEATRVASQAAEAAMVTFSDYVEIFLPWKTKGFSNPKHVAQWGMSLRKYAAPLANKPLVGITRQDIWDVLTQPVAVKQADGAETKEPMWDALHVSATRLRARLEALFYHAIQNGAYHQDNPARWELFNATLSAPRKLTGGHRPAMPRKDMPSFIQQLRGSKTVASLALEFLILTASRSGEVRLALWGEIDEENALWSIPAKRMKARRNHAVPLCPRALEILTEVKAQRNVVVKSDDYVFEGAKPGRPMSDMTIRAVMRRKNLGQYVPHGFRSAFKDWAANDTEFPRELAEEALAHQLNDVERAYRREQAVERRRALMLAWQNFVDGKDHDETHVIPFRDRR